MSADDLIFKFKRSGELNKMAANLLSQSQDSAVGEKLKATVKAMILSDLESNPGLLASLAQSKDHTVDQRRVAFMFERRVKSEIESGLAGKPIDDYINGMHDKLLNDIKTRLKTL